MELHPHAPVIRAGAFSWERRRELAGVDIKKILWILLAFVVIGIVTTFFLQWLASTQAVVTEMNKRIERY